MGYISGYNGSFNFSSPGVEFKDHNVMGMRVGCTLVGCLIIPVAFLTIWTLTESLAASAFTSLTSKVSEVGLVPDLLPLLPWLKPAFGRLTRLAMSNQDGVPLVDSFKLSKEGFQG